MTVEIDPELYSQAIHILTIKCKKLYAQNKFLKEKIAELEKKRGDIVIKKQENKLTEIKKKVFKSRI